MRPLEPRVPSNLNPYARELLKMLRGQPAARRDSDEAKFTVLRSLAEIEVRRPIERINDPDAKQRAIAVREFIRERLCASGEANS